MREIDAVLFDYGGVLTGPVKHSIAGWLAADAIEPESFSRTLRAWLSRDAEDGTPIHRLETGELNRRGFEALLAAELRTTDGRAVAPDGILGRLFAGMQPDPAMFALAEELRATGLKVGLLSNSWGNTYPRARIDALLDPVVISGEVGLRKPHAAIYELAWSGSAYPPTGCSSSTTPSPTCSARGQSACRPCCTSTTRRPAPPWPNWCQTSTPTRQESPHDHHHDPDRHRDRSGPRHRRRRRAAPRRRRLRRRRPRPRRGRLQGRRRRRSRPPAAGHSRSASTSPTRRRSRPRSSGSPPSWASRPCWSTTPASSATTCSSR